jgi:hypothetical protein
VPGISLLKTFVKKPILRELVLSEIKLVRTIVFEIFLVEAIPLETILLDVIVVDIILRDGLAEKERSKGKGKDVVGTSGRVWFIDLVSGDKHTIGS